MLPPERGLGGSVPGSVPASQRRRRRQRIHGQVKVSTWQPVNEGVSGGAGGEEGLLTEGEEVEVPFTVSSPGLLVITAR